jgi:hypothetical protein
MTNAQQQILLVVTVDDREMGGAAIQIMVEGPLWVDLSLPV